MDNPISDRFQQPGAPRVRIVTFDISGRIVGGEHSIDFPYDPSDTTPSLLILVGRNGSGKTTILRMIAGMLELNFDIFRRIPFKFAALRLSNGSLLKVESREDREFPLHVQFDNLSAELYRQRHSAPYSRVQRQSIQAFRDLALPILQQIDFELLDIHRSIALRGSDDDEQARPLTVDVHGRVVAPTRKKVGSLSDRVRDFVIEAQVNYRKFFVADELELLPRIIDRFETDSEPPTREELHNRIANVEKRSSSIRRFGLQSDDADLRSLAELADGEQANKPNARILIGAYVERISRAL